MAGLRVMILHFCFCTLVSASPPALLVGTSALQITDVSNASSMGLLITDRGHVILQQMEPAKVALAVKGIVSEQILSTGYDVAVQISNSTLVANATLIWGLKTRLLVTDQWEIVGSGSLARFELRRAITVLANPSVTGLLGIASHLMFDLATAMPSTKVSDLTVFAPALWYGNNSVLVGGGSIGSNKNLTDYFVRTDRFAAPLFSVLTPRCQKPKSSEPEKSFTASSQRSQPGQPFALQPGQPFRGRAPHPGQPFRGGWVTARVSE